MSSFSSLSAEICTVGTELLLGQIVDTNATYIARQLALIGIDVYFRSGVGDNPARMESVFRTALQRADILLLTGGLGPTQDDLTAQVLATVFDTPLTLHAETDRRIRERISRLNLKVGESTYRQSMVPAGATVFQNGVGTAPGLWLEREGKIAIAMPGVPAEMEGLMIDSILPALRKRTSQSMSVIRSKVLRLVGITESLAEEQILDLVQSQDNPTIAPYAGSGELKLRITAKAPDETAAMKLIEVMEQRVRERLGAYIFGADEETLDRAVGRLLLEKRMTIAAAESCTAGLLSAALTEMNGSSAYFMGGSVVYSNEAKVRELHVPQATLESHGAVSAETAAALAEGVRRVYGTDIGISITGIAGPGGGSAEKPVGLVYIGLATKTETAAERHHFSGGRATVRRRSVLAALRLLHRHITHS